MTVDILNIIEYILLIFIAALIVFIFNYYIRYFINKNGIDKKYLFIETIIFIIILLLILLMLAINEHIIGILSSILFLIIPYLYIFIKKRFYIKK